MKKKPPLPSDEEITNIVNNSIAKMQAEDSLHADVKWLRHEIEIISQRTASIGNQRAVRLLAQAQLSTLLVVAEYAFDERYCYGTRERAMRASSVGVELMHLILTRGRKLHPDHLALGSHFVRLIGEVMDHLEIHDQEHEQRRKREEQKRERVAKKAHAEVRSARPKADEAQEPKKVDPKTMN